MGNELTPGDLAPHLIRQTLPFLLDYSSGGGTGIVTVLDGGYHPKMRLKKATIISLGAALVVEPVLNVTHGGLEVVATIDLTSLLSATAVIGEIAQFTLIEAYRTLEEEDALQIEVETADSDANVRGLILFDYEVIE